MASRRPSRNDEPDFQMVKFGELVRMWRLDHGLSQRRLADKVGLSQTTISRLERGRAPGLALWSVLPILELGGIVASTRRIPLFPDERAMSPQ
jgi:DNA-binding XRE family transcriptional regulator